MKKFYLLNKWIFILLLIVCVSSVILIPQYVNPKTIKGIAIVDDLVFLAIGICLCIICGYIVVNQKSLFNMGESAYHSMNDSQKEEAVEMVEEAKTTGKYDVSNDLYDWAKAWGEEHINADEFPASMDYYGTGLTCPWYPETGSIYSYALPINETRNITAEVYAEAYAIADTHLLWVESYTAVDYFDFMDAHIYWRPQNDNQGSWSLGNSNAYVFTERYFTDVKTNTRFYLNLSVGGNIYTYAIPADPPKFILVAYNGLLYPSLVIHDSETVYSFVPIVSSLDGTLYNGFDTAAESDEQDIDVVKVPAMTDWVIDGHRYVPYYDEFGHAIGLYPAELIEGIESSIENQGVVAGELEQIDLRLAGWEVFLAKMANLDRLQELTFTETGELKVALENTQTSQYELDIPETEFDLPMLELLADKFPFCIPFDLYGAIANLVTTPVAPVFNINFPAEIFYGEADMELDFSIFENLAVVIRWIILLGFCIGLIILTRKLIRG